MRCCQTATDTEIEEDPDAYDCARCERTARADALWPENQEAWRLYSTLCGRTVTKLALHAWVLSEWFKHEPDWQPGVEMHKRMDLIAEQFDQAQTGRETGTDG